ncbi:TIGR01212 family radical SAM protein [Bacteroidales bacterium OttesenSCG-928-A17]|nr:TIGR01212 family radical SAM protein [Bacteroidales bacterium OttesenSCG-928-A17]
MDKSNKSSLELRSLSDLFAEHFPSKVQKISINAGFTCPNRDGNKGFGGCTYCNNQTFSPQYTGDQKSINQQLEEGIRFFSHKYPTMKYIAYFQSYTNTYGDISDLMDKYQTALNHPEVIGLIIATRPDCMPNALLDELQKLNEKYFLLIEYGVETTNNHTLKYINRGHSYEDAVDAITRTHERGILCGAHLILGLPGESKEMILAHANRISQLPLTTLKLHQLQLIRGTKMAHQYEKEPELFRLPSVDDYIDLCIEFMERLSPDIIIERFVSQSPKELLIAPDWGLKNYEFTAKLNKRIRERNTFQGRLFS